MSLVKLVRVATARLEWAIASIFQRFPPDGLCLAVISEPPTKSQQPSFSIKDILGDGFLLAVPRHRRTIEKRLKRKFGDPEHVLKILRPKRSIRVCNVCGDEHLVGILCPTCYKKVIEETKQMQDAIQEKLQLKPVEKEVVVLYEGEKDAQELYEGKLIVEMEKPRPQWFSKNLLQQTTQQPATSTNVKPSDLE